MPENGEDCTDENFVCQSGTEYCACLDLDGDLSWRCLDIGSGGRGNFGGFGNFGSGGLGAGGFGNFGGRN
jgi:hypothetical protein